MSKPSPTTKKLSVGTTSTPSVTTGIENIWTLSCVTLVVEEQSFDLSKDELLESSYFRRLLGAPPGATTDKLPCTCKNMIKPIVLKDVRAIEMDALCRVLYGKGKPVNGCDEWMRVLCLAHRWDFEAIRALAINNLADFVSNNSSIRKMELGKQFRVVDWTLSGLAAIVQTQDLDVEQLVNRPYSFDYEMASRILSLRSQAALKASRIRNSTCNQCADESYGYPEWDALFLFHARALVHQEFYEKIPSLFWGQETEDLAPESPQWLAPHETGVPVVKLPVLPYVILGLILSMFVYFFR